MVKFVCVHGNIGAGKSTFISKLNNTNNVCLQEPLEKWGSYLQKYYDALNYLQTQTIQELQHPTNILTLQSQHDIINFEIIITNIRLQQYSQITNERIKEISTQKNTEPDQLQEREVQERVQTERVQTEHVYIFERSIEESWLIFCQELKQYLTSEQWKFLQLYFDYSIQQEIQFDTEYYFSAPTQTLMERIKQRGRQEEQDMSYNYLDKLNQKYEKFYEEHKDKLIKQ